jgi:hypothetical protein
MAKTRAGEYRYRYRDPGVQVPVLVPVIAWYRLHFNFKVPVETFRCQLIRTKLLFSYLLIYFHKERHKYGGNENEITYRV